MKNITVKAIALVLTLILTLSIAALAESGKIGMDGFDPNSNATANYHGILLFIPGYYDRPYQRGNAAYFQVSGMTVNGDAPAMMVFDVVQQGYAVTRDEFLRQDGAMLDNLLSMVPNAQELGREENCTVAGCPAAAMDYRFQNEYGSYYSVMFLVYNQSAQELLRLQLIETTAGSVDFTDDFMKVISYAQINSGASSSAGVPTQAPVLPQVSQKVRTLCENYLSSVERANYLMNTVDLDALSIGELGLLFVEVETLYSDISNFLDADTAGWSNADLAYYQQAQDAVTEAVLRQIVNWIMQNIF